MTQCIAYGCCNRVKKKQTVGECEVKSSLSFHRFPNDAELKEKWIRAVRREKWQPSDHSRICSDHFRERDYDNSSPFRKFLKKDAVPSVFLAFPPHLQPSSSKLPRRVLKRNLSPIQSPIPEKISKTDLEITSDKLEKTQQKLIETKKKLRNIKLKQKRLKVKVANLKDIVKELKNKNLIQSEHCELLSNISKTSFCLMQRESQKHINPKMKKMFDDRLRNFATTLHFLSPKAYNFVRSTFQTCLPHPRTIAKWYYSINAEPGFSSEVFRVLKEKCQNQPSLVCSLMFDAMAIRQHIDWDGKKLYGYMDLGRGNTDDGAPVANEVFVIRVHLVCINALWKIPLGYFFIKGISGEHIYSLTSQCLQLLSEVNIKVASIACDGTSSNLSSFVRFGCNLKDPYQLQTHFTTGAHHVNVFLDPPHMLKLVRNSLHDLRELMDSDGRIISWIYFEKLLQLQEKEGLNLGNKIKKQHVCFNNQKMKVRLAAQLLSTSVADALKYCKMKNIPGFEECDGTIEFIKIFNDLFDVLNSRSIKEKYLKQAINENNEDEIFLTLEKAENYIRSLREKNGKVVLNGSRKTGFMGFLICISSMRTLYDRLVKRERALKYIPMYKVSQDHLERLFGYIRRRGGTNDNPSAYEFCHLFRKIIVHKQLHESDASSGNAIPLDKIDLLGLGFGRKIASEESINLSTPKSSMLDSEVSREDDSDEECLELQETVFSDLVLDVVEYIAGYVVRGLGRKIKCEECLAAISKDNDNSPLSLSIWSQLKTEED